MTRLIDQIKAEQLAARKDKNALAAALLTTLIGEATAIGKNDGNREVTDSEVVAVVKKFIKGIDETMSAMTNASNNDGSADRYVNLMHEKEILNRFLPVQLSELDLQKIVGTLAQALPERNPRQMGVLMKQLKEKHEGQYDGALASKVIKAVLSV